ncbi:hypothetical protein H0H92_000692 [Tricholoma furcatifolium]|nr:hypothetical protein H0H92_000692 [Tricholoma furcatifolium]
MGRRAKSFTEIERQAAARERDHLYLQSSRGKELRSAQNRRAYQTRVARQVTSDSMPKLQLPALPIVLRESAHFPPPKSPTFKLAFQAKDTLGSDYRDDRLRHWDSLPPYSQPHPYNVQYLQDVLFGSRLRRRKEEEVARMQRYNSHPLHAFAREVHADLLSAYTGWKALHRELQDFDGSTSDRRLGQGLLQWRAWIVCELEKDFIALEWGNHSFLTVFADRWYPY